METRRTLRRSIDEFFLCYRHQHIPKSELWIAPFINHMESNIWLDTQASGDLWNGRWTEELIQSLLQNNATHQIAQRTLTKTLKWLRTLTSLLQRTQKAIYNTRRMELLALEAKNRRTAVIALRQRRSTRRAQTLYAAWRIPYTAPDFLRKRRTSLMPAPLPLPRLNLSDQLHRAHGKWLQYSKARVKAADQNKPSPSPLHRRIAKTSKREDHRTRKLKLCKIRNKILLSR